MPWKERSVMDERVRFISGLLDGETMTDLCSEFGISRKTGYKFWNRYLLHGINGLLDISKTPLKSPNKTPEEIEKLIIRFRKKKPYWGPKKLKVKLDEANKGLTIPVPSTIGEILKRNGLVQPRKKKRPRSHTYFPSQLSKSKSPNDVWCVDFKGEFRLKNGLYCYPLTITDHFSRYLLCCEGLENMKWPGVMTSFIEIFKIFGLPEAIRSDNGHPFVSNSVWGLSRLSAWWVKLGIKIERIEPGHPEQNGRHERMHLTLKKEATRPPSRTFLRQQERFDTFLDEYNTERPHEALDMKSPSKVYIPSSRSYLEQEKELKYPLSDKVRKVSSCGHIKLWNDKQCFIGRALAGENVGLREIELNNWLVSYGSINLGYINKENKFYERKHGDN